jgi:hypothetical protein
VPVTGAGQRYQLEAIFLSTFVMIGQDPADAKRKVIADQQWRMVQEENEQNK